MPPDADPDDTLRRQLVNSGYAFGPSALTRRLLDRHGGLADWGPFADSWSDLGPDPYLAVTGRNRQRRFGVVALERTGAISRLPHQPHYQSRQYNPLQGGIERWFEPISAEAGASQSLHSIVRLAGDLFSPLAPDVAAWRVELHQFRISASTGHAGEPTPEGAHRDGVEFVLVLLIARHNISRGTTGIHALVDGQELGSFTLTQPLDAAFVDDRRVLHAVTPVEALAPEQPSYRDVLVVTLRRR